MSRTCVCICVCMGYAYRRWRWRFRQQPPENMMNVRWMCLCMFVCVCVLGVMVLYTISRASESSKRTHVRIGGTRRTREDDTTIHIQHDELGSGRISHRSCYAIVLQANACTTQGFASFPEWIKYDDHCVIYGMCTSVAFHISRTTMAVTWLCPNAQAYIPTEPHNTTDGRMIASS